MKAPFHLPMDIGTISCWGMVIFKLENPGLIFS